jgi:hypothetical protein
MDLFEKYFPMVFAGVFGFIILVWTIGIALTAVVLYIAIQYAATL